MNDVDNLVDLLRARAAASPDAVPFTFLADGDATEVPVTYQWLDGRARAIASRLRQIAPAGARAFLLYPPSPDYLAGLFGCFYAGLVAVPAYPPDPTRLARTLPRIQRIVADAQAAVVLTTGMIAGLAGGIGSLAPDLVALPWISTDCLDEVSDPGFRAAATGPETTAFLQYTSGSTDFPKGVVLSHGNLLDNLRRMRDAVEAGPDDIAATWLPPYHDMGLIGLLLQTMHVGARTVWMSPLDFLRRPLLWLQMISRHRATVSGAPNFAFDLCVRKVTAAERADLDLSRWRIAFCGAEPIRAETMERFARTFAGCGFRREAIYPCYGLAEATLMVSGPERRGVPLATTFDREAIASGRALARPADHPRAIPIVACGEVIPGHEVAIVDPERPRPAAADQIGEIWVHGPSVAQGYFGHPEETEVTFAARLPGDDRRWLRTGDLGFLHGGQLHLCGRSKDLIVLRGRNLYPSDLEKTVEAAHAALRPGCSCAFSIDVAGEERLVIACELDRRAAADAAAAGSAAALGDEVIERVRAALTADQGVAPHAVVIVAPNQIPKTSSGKHQRRACRDAFLAGSLERLHGWQVDESPREPAADPPPAAAGRRSAREIERWLVERIATHANLPAAAVDVDRPFSSFAIDSVEAVSLVGDLSAWLGAPLPLTAPWDHPTIELLSRHLAGAAPAAVPAPAAAAGREPIAIVGMGCRLPGGAAGAGDLWRLLASGTDAISEVPPERWDVDAVDDPVLGAAGVTCSRWGGFLPDVDRFDARAFGIHTREAARMDPQQRMLLEVAWEALDDAGVPPESLAGSATGVFVGVCNADYAQLQMRPEMADVYLGTGSALSLTANRISYAYDLRGPSMAIDTACSSSLVAIHMACQSLWSGEATMAVAGGANLILTPTVTLSLSRGLFMAADGRCKSFDARADGYVRSEGVALVVLKPLSRALADGDLIRAVILGGAVNQDGRTNGLTAPNRAAQVAVVQAACRSAGVTAGALQYLETHGTGTALGDAIEASALGEALAEGRTPGDSCLIGSIKSNLGHLEAAAGVAGLMKVALALEQGTIPASLHFERPNPAIDFARLPLSVAAEASPWPAGRTEKLAGVSSFGFGGTNAHVILTQAPPPAEEPRRTAGAGPWLLPISSHDEETLRATAGSFAAAIEDEAVELGDLCHAAATRRTPLQHRAAIVADSRPELLAALRAAEGGRGHPGLAVGERRGRQGPPVFVYSGQGAQWARMGLELLDREPVFRAEIERTGRELERHVGWSLVEALADEERLGQTEVAQPAIFAVQVALTAQWRAWGVTPSAVIGHSMGEVAAAWAAGALSFSDAVRIIAARGRIMQRVTGRGATAAIGARPEEIEADLRLAGGAVSISGYNGPASITIAGDAGAVDELLDRIRARGLFGKRLPVHYAFHSAQMDPLRPALAAALDGIAPRPTAIPLMSTVTGSGLSGAELGPAYWADNIRQPVRFAPAVATLLAAGHASFLEIGPHPVLSPAIAECASAAGATALVVPSLRRQDAGRRALLRSLGALFAGGVEVDLTRLHAGPARRVRLPRRAWRRDRHWLPGLATPGAAAGDRADRCHRLTWEATGAPAPAGSSAATWIVLADRGGVGRRLAAELERRGARCAVVERPDRADDVDLGALLAGPAAGGSRRVAYLWALDAALADPRAIEEWTCLAPLRLAQALGAGGARPPVWWVTSGAHPIDGSRPSAAQRPLWGFARTLRLEQPDVEDTLLDLDPREDAAGQLVQVAFAPASESELAVRRGQRFRPRLETHAGDGAPAAMDPQRTYLITGGLGAAGLALAGELVAAGARHLALLGRRAPDAAAIAALDALGKEAALRCHAVDVADPEALAGALDEVRRSQPPLAGVYHAAGVLEDRPIPLLEPDAARRVLAAKVRGGLNLHLATRADQLDHFVLFSSLASLVGSPGQAAYAAGNGFLDGLAEQRRAEGSPGLSVSWGPWSGPGMAARTAAASRSLAIVRPIAPRAATGRLLRLLAGADAHLAVFALNEEVAADARAAGALPPLLASLLPGDPVPAARRARTFALDDALRADLRSPARAGAALERLLLDTARSLGVEPSRAIGEMSLSELGLDSLMAIELNHALGEALGITLPVAFFLRRLPIAALGRELAERAGATADGGPPALTRGPLVRPTLSFHQERTCRFERELGPTGLFTIFEALRLRGPLDAGALDRAITAIVSRHEILRTGYDLAGAEARPVLHPAPASVLTCGDPGADIDERLSVECTRPLSLASPLMLRAELVPLGADDHALLFSFHHIAVDWWSGGIFMRELFTLYEAFRTGRPSPLDPPGLQHADYAAWQRTWLTGSRLDDGVAWWLGHLREASFVHLPVRRPPREPATMAGGRVVVRLAGDELAAVRAACRQGGATPFMALSGSLAGLIAAWNDRPDAVLFVHVANRDQRRTGEVFGCLVNHNAVRVQTGSDPTFGDLVEAGRQSSLRVAPYQHIPYMAVADALRPRHDLDLVPPARLNLLDAPPRGFRVGALEVELMRPPGVPRVKNRLAVEARAGSEELELELQYNSDLVDEAQAREAGEALRSLLVRGSRDPSLRLSKMLAGGGR